MTNLLDEIINEDKNSNPRPPLQNTASHTALAPSPGAQRATHPTSDISLGSLGISEQPPPVHYPEEMEWTPTHSKYRAFNDFGAPDSQSKAFGDSPTNPGASPFWYKVPPAPSPPGARLRKAPTTVLRKKPVEKEAVFYPANDRPLQPNASPQPKEEQGQQVTFSQPSFFATSERNANDPRNTLVDMLASTFTLGADEESSDEVEMADRPDNADIELKIRLPARKGMATNRLLDAFMLVVLLGIWLHATSGYYSYSRDTMLGSICLSIAVGIRLTSDALANVRARTGPLGLWAANMTVGIAELVLACHTVVQIWRSGDVRFDTSFASRGLGVMGVMLVHGIWSSIMYI